jgi:primosomal protein N' (replication factor Y)
VLVQTMAPAARSIVLAAQHDSDGFLRGELRRRKALAYPPFTTLIRVICATADASAAHAAATDIAANLTSAGVAVLGPAPLFMLRGKARVQLLIKTTVREPAIAAVSAAVDAISPERRHHGVAFSVDVDPQ